MAVIEVEPAVKYSFVLKGMQTRRKGQYNAELTLSPRLYVKPLITPITGITKKLPVPNKWLALITNLRAQPKLLSHLQC